MAIGFQKTPGTPVEVTFAASTSLPNDNQEVLMFGRAAEAATGIETVITLSNVSDVTLASAEVATKFGAGSELAKMVIAAVEANALAGNSNFPVIKCVPLEHDATTITTAAQNAAKKVKAEFIVSPFDGSSDSANRTTLKELCAELSGAQRVQNNQFGTIGVIANQSVSDPANLPSVDSQYISAIWFRNSVPVDSVGELAARYAALMAGNIVPFKPINNFIIGGLDAPSIADQESIGAGLESETALTKGWCPVKVDTSNNCRVVRSVVTRVTSDGSTITNDYIDVQDFQVLYYLRKALFTRFNQPDFKNSKASNEVAKNLKAETIRICSLFEDNEMLQNVATEAKNITVTKNVSDSHRFDVYVPTNVIPGLHVIATSIVAVTV